MNCEDYQRLLHLNRAGEISVEEAEELRRHLRLCEKCTLEYRRIQRADQFIDRISAFTPASINPGKLTADILRRVSEESAASHDIDLLSRMLDFFLQPSIRYATVAIILLIISTFMYQLMTTLSGVSAVEQQMALVSNQTTVVPQTTYTAESKTLQEVSRSKDVKSLTETWPVTVRGDRVEVPAKALESIAPLYDLRNVSAAIGSSALHMDRITLERIINEVKATAELTLHLGREGA